MSVRTVAVLGASGYAGGEFLRLALGHPCLRVTQVTSRSNARLPVPLVHPNLRSVTDLRFVAPEDLRPADVVVSALPHGELSERLDDVAPLLDGSGVLVDLSSDFRLKDAEAYRLAYGRPHPRPEYLGDFVYALPELHRDELRGAGRIAGAGCIATAAILALAPTVRAGLIDRRRDVVMEAKVGSSAAGSDPNLASHHPERSGAVRTYAPTRHRHLFEIQQALPEAPPVHLTATAVERVRGVLVTAHLWVEEGVRDTDVLAAIRSAYAEEPFVRLVRAQRGVHRVPDPRILDGTNYCDVGFDLDEETGRLVMMAALDNLVKGTAGHAMQSLNVALGHPEGTGLAFTGLHP